MRFTTDARTFLDFELPSISRASKADKLYLRFLKALHAAGPLKMYLAWAVNEKVRVKHGNVWLWDKMKNLGTLDEYLPTFPKKEKVTEGDLDNRSKRLLDLDLDDLLEEVLWAIVNQPLNKKYCYTLGIACGLMMGKRMEMHSTSARIALPGVFSKREMALETYGDIQDVLSELRIDDLRVFRQNKKLRDTFFNKVDEKINSSRGYTLSQKRVMDIARLLLNAPKGIAMSTSEKFFLSDDDVLFVVDNESDKVFRVDGPNTRVEIEDSRTRVKVVSRMRRITASEASRFIPRS